MNCKHYTEKVGYVKALVNALYSLYEGSCGGLLHIVVDDGNLEDEDIKWCIDYCNREENSDRPDKPVCLLIANEMLKMTEEERKLIYYSAYSNFGLNCNRNCKECVIERGELYG